MSTPNQNGKGSNRRGNSKAERERFEAGWDRIFSKKKRNKPVTVEIHRPDETSKPVTE